MKYQVGDELVTIHGSHCKVTKVFNDGTDYNVQYSDDTIETISAAYVDRYFDLFDLAPNDGDNTNDDLNRDLINSLLRKQTMADTSKYLEHESPVKPDYRQLIVEECDALKDLLLEKNLSYGSSCFEPIRVFSKDPPAAQIRTRIDDKLSRITMGREYQHEDTLQDTAGYIILLMIANRLGLK